MRIGIFGGSFNPPHLGHMHLAESVHDALSLDEVLLVPSKISPHRSMAAYAPEQAERFALRISEPYSSRHGSQEYHELDFMIRFTDGRYFVFQMEERIGDDLRYLRQLLDLKERFGPEIVRVEDAELLPDLIRDQNWTGEAKVMAQKLFQSSEKEK